MTNFGLIRYRVTSSLIEEHVDIESRTIWEAPYYHFFDTYGDALLATNGLPDYVITRVETVETFVSSSEGASVQ